jgi:hypothetical protein
MKCQLLKSVALLAAIALTLVGETRAALIAGWGLETGNANGVLSEGVAGTFSSTATGNAAPRAVLGSPIGLGGIGQGVKLTGKISMANAPGNQQLRIGLYNSNGQNLGTLSGGVWSGATATSWLGYMLQVGGSGGGDDVKGRTIPSGGAWLSNTGAYSIGTTAGTGVNVPANTVYDFLLRIVRTGATTVSVNYSFVGGTVNRSGSFTDDSNTLNHQSATTASINAVGFLLNTNTGTSSFTDVDVSAIPEPTSAAMLMFAVPAIAALRRRRAT